MSLHFGRRAHGASGCEQVSWVKQKHLVSWSNSFISVACAYNGAEMASLLLLCTLSKSEIAESTMG